MDNPSIRYPLILTVQVLNGFMTGLIFSLVYFLPFFVTAFLLIFVFGILLPASTTLILLAFIVSWVLVYLYSMRRRIDFDIPEVNQPRQDVYPLKRRDIDILQSEEPPIICEYCRSFIRSDSKLCPVCDHPVNTSSNS